jgi:hypothetical protein
MLLKEHKEYVIPSLCSVIKMVIASREWADAQSLSNCIIDSLPICDLILEIQFW